MPRRRVLVRDEDLMDGSDFVMGALLFIVNNCVYLRQGDAIVFFANGPMPMPNFSFRISNQLLISGRADVRGLQQ